MAQHETFGQLLDGILASNPEALTKGSGERESAIINQIVSQGRGPRPHYPPAGRSISKDAERLIVACEVTSEGAYKNLYQRPTWPKGASGVTVGIGYDVGYVDKNSLRSDWQGLIDPAMIDALSTACGVKGMRARALAHKLSTKVSIPWAAAERQFHQTTLPLYVAQTLDHNILPGATKLSNADCLGALVSLVFNRGPSFKLQGERYKEMRAIRLHIVKGELHKVPGEIRSMRRLWAHNPDARGLVLRRNLEARLFEQGLGIA